jgi:hypothetical protein
MSTQKVKLKLLQWCRSLSCLFSPQITVSSTV